MRNLTDCRCATRERSSVDETSRRGAFTRSTRNPSGTSSGRAGPLDHGDRAQPGHLVATVPGTEPRRGVGSQHQDEVDRRILRAQFTQCVHRVGTTTPTDLDVTRSDTRETVDRGGDERETGPGVADPAGAHLLPRLVRHDHQDLVEAEPVPDVDRRHQVSDVGRVERPAEDPDPSASRARSRRAPVGTTWNRTPDHHMGRPKP